MLGFRKRRSDKTGDDKSQGNQGNQGSRDADASEATDVNQADAQAEAARTDPETGQADAATEPTEPTEPTGADGAGGEAGADQAADPGQPATRPGWMARLRERLTKTRTGFTEGLATAFLGRKVIDDELLEELETRLLVADVGVEATSRIIDGMVARMRRKELGDVAALMAALRKDMIAILEPCEAPLVPDPAQRPFVVLTVGVNGVGKTTTIGKLGSRWKAEGKKVMLAAGDTFRAAAVEQLQRWGKTTGLTVIAQHSGADSASVIYDALQAARSRGVDVLIADTAGRLHTQSNLMEELRKVRRVLGKQGGGAPHETLLVLDAGTGQNALSQAKHFHEAVNVTGLVLTKLDGTAKGGVIFAIAQQLGLPIRYIGVGEGVEDLRPFKAAEFVDALLGDIVKGEAP